MARQGFSSLLTWESPGSLVQLAVPAISQVPGEPDGTWVFLEQAIKVILRRKDVWENTDGEGGRSLGFGIMNLGFKPRSVLC